MSGQFEEAYLAGGYLDIYPTYDELHNVNEIFDLNAASQEGFRSRDVLGDYELLELPELPGRRWSGSNSVLPGPAEISPDDDDGLFAGISFDDDDGIFAEISSDDDGGLFAEISSDDDDGLFAKNMSSPSTEFGEDELDGDRDKAAKADLVLKWKIDHSSGDHKLNGKAWKRPYR